MSDGSNGKVLCEGCQAAYAWKPERSGKRLRCKCGAAVSFPVEPPESAPTSASTQRVKSERPAPRASQAVAARKTETSGIPRLCASCHRSLPTAP